MMNLKTILMQILFLSFVLLLSCSGKDTQSSDDKKLLKTIVETTYITPDDAIRNHHIPAVFLAKNRANLSFQLSGTVNHVMVKIGEKVESGQALMSLYNPNIDPALESNLAQLESINAKIVQVKRDVANLKELRKNNTTSKTDYEHKETDLKDLIAQQKSVKAQINLALANQSESTIKAPFDSTIIAINRQVGEFAGAGQQMITVNQQSSVEVEVNLTRSLWENLKLGDNVSAIYRENTITFKVTELSQTAESQSHLMKVVLELNDSLKNVIGHQVTLLLPQKYRNTYRLPLEVVVDDGINNPYVFTFVDGIATKNPIKPLYIENGEIIFNTALPIIDAVVIKGQSKISMGMQLQVSQ